jgi:hypothetical protein
MESTLKHGETHAGIEGRLIAQQKVASYRVHVPITSGAKSFRYSTLLHKKLSLSTSPWQGALKNIAVAGKQDGSAMKVIAVLTIVFHLGR